MKKPSKRLTRPPRGKKPAKRAPKVKPGPVPSPFEHGLTPAQLVFAEVYLTNRVASRAYLEAHPGVTTRTAEVEGSKLLRNPEVRTFIEARLAEKHGPIHASADEALSWYALVMSADPALAYNEKGELLPISQWPPELRAVVKATSTNGLVLESKRAVARDLLELAGKLKSKETESADLLVEALRKTFEQNGRH